MNLSEIATKYNSDKLQHNYFPFYEKHLPEKVSSLLEIGILKGESMKIWKDAFPGAKLYGLDLFKIDPIPDIKGVNWIKGNQLDHVLLYDIRNNIKPEIIIEDCSHNCRSHWVTFWSLIGCCKKYFVEDLHTCREEFYREGLTFDQTILGAMLSDKFPFEFELSNDQKIAVIYAHH